MALAYQTHLTSAPSENRTQDTWNDKQAFYPSATEHGQKVSLETELMSCISELTSSVKPQLWHVGSWFYQELAHLLFQSPQIFEFYCIYVYVCVYIHIYRYLYRRHIYSTYILNFISSNGNLISSRSISFLCHGRF